jgi:hypothetical protein
MEELRRAYIPAFGSGPISNLNDDRRLTKKLSAANNRVFFRLLLNDQSTGPASRPGNRTSGSENMAAISWKSPVSGNWTVAADWSTGKVPTLSDDVTIAAPGSYTVTVSSNGVIVHPIGGLQADAIPFGVPDEANSLTFDAAQATLQENAGALDVAGPLTVSAGLVSLNEANTIGSVAIDGGTLAFGNGGALGAGPVALSGGELLGSADETLSNELILSGTSTIAAADGTTLTETGFTSFGANSTLNFGALGQDGVIIWNQGTASINAPVTLNVVAGTLKAGSIILAATISDGARPTTVAAGATLDLGGFGLNLINLLGGGAVIDSGAPATLTLAAANFSGRISGALSLILNGATTLSGLEDYTGGATLDGAITVTNAGTYDLVANTNITGSAGSFFANNNIFEKTDGGGISDVTSNFFNSGALNVLSGSIEFSGGFTNDGVIHGRVTQSGGVTTVSALVPSDFNEDGTSGLLWQNTTSGQASVWDMNANALTGGGPVSPDPGRRACRHPMAERRRSCVDLGNEREPTNRRRTGQPQSRAGLESGGDRRLQRRRLLRHPVSKHQHGPSLDLGDGGEQTHWRRTGQPQSGADLESDRNRRFQ